MSCNIMRRGYPTAVKASILQAIESVRPNYKNVVDSSMQWDLVCDYVTGLLDLWRLNYPVDVEISFHSWNLPDHPSPPREGFSILVNVRPLFDFIP